MMGSLLGVNHRRPFGKIDGPGIPGKPGGAEFLPLIEIALCFAVAAKKRFLSPKTPLEQFVNIQGLLWTAKNAV